MEPRIRKSAIPKEVVVLGKRIKFLIKEKGLSVRDVAYDAGMDTENLRKYLRASQEMKVSTLMRIAKAMDVEVGELFQKKSSKN